MKKIIVFLFLVFSFYANLSLAQADDKPPRGFLSIAGGPSVSNGNFSDNTWNNDRSGFAKNGYNYAVEFGFKFIPNFGLSAAIKGAILPLDVQALADGYAKEYGGQFTVTSTRWAYTGFFVGPYVCIPTKYVDIDFKFMTGLLAAVSPDMTVSRDGQVSSQEASAGSSIGFNGGLGARIHLLKKFSLITQAEYHLSRPTFQLTFVDTNNSTESAGQLITMFNFSFGVAMRLF